MKKALAISFKFILSIIVGAIILIFFINLAFQHTKTSEKLSAATITNYFELNLDILATSPRAHKQIEIKEGRLDLSCNYISLTNKEESRIRTEKIISSPSILSNKIQVWTQAWNFPFKVTNFYYLADKTNFYIENQEILEKIPNRFNKYPLKDFKQDKNSIIIYSSNPGYIPTKRALIIQGNSITFYPEKQTTTYYGDEMLYLAIFSKNYFEYNCLKRKSLNRLNQIASLYQEKASLLKTKTQKCIFIYDNLIKSLEDLKTNQNPLIVEKQNKLLDKNDCPTLY